MNQSAGPMVFNATSLHLLSGDRQYRVYVRDDELFFVRIGGQNADVAASQFGLLGALISAFFRRGDKTAEDIARLDDSHPRNSLADHKHNFSVRASEIVDSVIEPAPTMPQHGPCVGRWTFALRDGKKWKLQFVDLEQMHCAVRCLAKALGTSLRVGVRWNEHEQRYVKA